jgi:hypothetical protein
MDFLVALFMVLTGMFDTTSTVPWCHYQAVTTNIITSTIFPEVRRRFFLGSDGNV